ncbi:MAG: glycosyltransferase family A protein [Ardenticatenaceae bacterium]|nr:glycosyltransferase family A protein [Ardenticatenaceae bacterium]
MFCSTIIPTVGRPSLERAVDSVLSQDFPSAECEVIVVNDSGRPLPSQKWQLSNRVSLVTTQCRERSVARNTGAAVARGKYLHFLDDDDWLLPGALQAFWNLDQVSPAAVWLYGSYQTVDNVGCIVDIWEPGIRGNIFALQIAGESLPFQTSLLKTEVFHAVGGFDTDPAIIGVEDRELGRRMGLYGNVAYSPYRMAAIRIGEASSTTNWTTIGQSDRLGREKALRQNGVRARLQRSITDSRLAGRVSRGMFASALWNVEQHDFLTAGRRCGLSVLLGLPYVLSRRFWQGLLFQ